MQPNTIEVIATVLFGLAVLHTFLVGRFQHLAASYPEGSIQENFYHLLGEVEVVFGFWAGIFVVAIMVIESPATGVNYVEKLNFTEPLFVFAIMTVAATRPVIEFSRFSILKVAALLPMPAGISAYLVCLALGPLLGSLITEPAAMTVTALVLRELFFVRKATLSEKAKYVTLAVLLVNISIGGVLTHFAAPPVLMVAGTWGWGFSHMLTHFGWKAVLAVFLNAAGAVFLLRKELAQADLTSQMRVQLSVPLWLIVIHGLFMALIVINAHHVVIFMGLFLYFLGLTGITREYQDALKLREALLVAFFLGGLVTLGGLQRWWLEPIIVNLGDVALFLGAAGLTAITDNAALTYLGSQVPDLSEMAKYALVAGAVTGGGLTVIANAPNPIAFSVLQELFEEGGIKPIRLFIWAIGPTVIAGLFFWLLP